MEILNQYMNNWKGFHVSYTLNTMYYYIYQSFLLQPPIKISQIAQPAPEPKPKTPPRQPPPMPSSGGNEDREFKEVCVRSKVDDLVNMMCSISNKLAIASATMSEDLNEVHEVTDKISTRKAILESEVEYMEKNMEKINIFIENNEGKEISNIDEFITPEDEISDLIITFLADEKACEETMGVIKERFRKKKISLDDYLDATRTLSNEQFMCMAQRRKIMSILSAVPRKISPPPAPYFTHITLTILY